MSDKKAASHSLTTDDGRWELFWERAGDILVMRYGGYLSDSLATSAMSQALTMFEAFKSDLRIYTIADVTQVTGFSPTLLAATVLHESFYHPQAGKLYVVGANAELRLYYDALNTRYADSVRFVDSLEDATRDIDQHRTTYHARQQDGDKNE